MGSIVRNVCDTFTNYTYNYCTIFQESISYMLDVIECIVHLTSTRGSLVNFTNIFSRLKNRVTSQTFLNVLRLFKSKFSLHAVCKAINGKVYDYGKNRIFSQ